MLRQFQFLLQKRAKMWRWIQTYHIHTQYNNNNKNTTTTKTRAGQGVQETQRNDDRPSRWHQLWWKCGSSGGKQSSECPTISSSAQCRKGCWRSDKKWLGMIELSVSLSCSPIVPVKEKDSKLCIDYRALNCITEYEAELIPHPEQLYVELQN